MNYKLNLFIFVFCLLFGVVEIRSQPSKEGDNSNPTQEGPSPARQIDLIHRHSFGLGIGETFLGGDFRKHGDNSITPELYYAYSASYSFDFVANGHYSKHKHQSDRLVLQGLDFGIKGKFYQFDAFSPFALAGVGFYRPKTTRFVGTTNTYIESEGRTAFGVHFGLGADLTLNEHFNVGMIGHFHNPFDIKQDVGPAVNGFYFKFLMVVMYIL